MHLLALVLREASQAESVPAPGQPLRQAVVLVEALLAGLADVGLGQIRLQSDRLEGLTNEGTLLLSLSHCRLPVLLGLLPVLRRRRWLALMRMLLLLRRL